MDCRYFAWIGSFSCLMAGGCVWPGVTHPKCELQIVTQDSSVMGHKEAAPRSIVLTYWYHPATGSVEGMKAFVTNSRRVPLRYGMRFYPVVWTPALGTQHAPPEPSVIVFSDGYLPAIGHVDGEHRRLCCAPPRAGPHVVTAILRPQENPQSKQDADLHSHSVKPAVVLRAMRRIERAVKALGDSDKHAVYEGLLQLADRDDSPEFRAELTSRLNSSVGE